MLRIRLLAAIGGHDVGELLDHDPQAAEWLIAAGFAVATDDTGPTDPAEALTTPPQRPAAPARRSGKRAAR